MEIREIKNGVRKFIRRHIAIGKPIFKQITEKLFDSVFAEI